MQPVPIEFLSEGVCVRGRFFAAEGTHEPTTFLFVPGWPADPDDFLGLGPLLSQRGINMVQFAPRGLNPSDGILTHAGTLQDIRSAMQWLRQADVHKRFKVDPASLVLGGYSYGGGMALAYAARDPAVRRVISIAGMDHGELAREMQRNASFAAEIFPWVILPLRYHPTRKPQIRIAIATTISIGIQPPSSLGLQQDKKNPHSPAIT